MLIVSMSYYIILDLSCQILYYRYIGGHMKSNLAFQIKKRRLEVGKTQEQVAKLLGVEAITISCYENARILIPVDKLLKLAEIIECHICDLISAERPIRQDPKLPKRFKTKVRMFEYLSEFGSEAVKAEIAALKMVI